MPKEWDSFLWAADQWLVAYSMPPGNLVAVKLFSVGHALELYLKACYTKLTGDIDTAIQFGHNVSEIWFQCKMRDDNFLPTHELRRSVLARELLNGEDVRQLSRDDLLHFIRNQEFYVTCKYLADLKYLGAPLKKVTGAWALGFICPNPQWGILFHDLRSYLGYAQGGGIDDISHYIEAGELSPVSVLFLEQVISG